MEAQGHTLGDVFLGYNRSILPGALHSTQEKGEAIKQQANCKKRPRFFELLATVAGQFLQNDGDFEGSSEFINHRELSNDCKRLMLDTKASHLVEVCMQQSPKESSQTCNKPQSSNPDTHKNQKNIENIGSSNCVKMPKCDSLILCDLPIPSFVKNIMNHEAMYQSNGIPINQHIPISTNCQLNLNIHYQENKFMKLDCGQATIEGRNNIVENEEYIISEDPLLNNVTMHCTQTGGENFSQDAMKGSQQVYTLSQLHDPICESFKLFHNFHLNFEGFQPINSFINNKDSLSKKIDACENTCFSKKENLKILSNDLLNGQTTEKEHNVLIKSLISDSIHLGCTNSSQPLNSLGNIHYLNCKTIEKEDVKSFIKDQVREKELKCDENERTRKNQSSQELFYDELIKNPLEDYKNGIKPCEATTNCNNELKSQKNQLHEGDSKRTENIAPTKQTFFNGIAACTRQRTSRRMPLKRKQFEDGNKCSLDPQMNTNHPINVAYNGVYGEPPAAAAKLRSAKAASVSSSPNSKGAAKTSTKKFVEPHVKFGINSFTIPEFFVDLPESASISTLKGAVMEAAIQLLGGPLQVRVLMHGNKVMDEGATLLQSGILSSSIPPPNPSPNPNSSPNPKLQPLDAVGFMLEPCSSPSSPCAMSDNHVFQIHSSSPSSKGRLSHVHGAHHTDPLPLPGFQAYGVSTYSHLPHSTRVAAVGALVAIRAQADANRRLKNEGEEPIGCRHGGKGGSGGVGSGLGLEGCGARPVVVHHHPHGGVGMHRGLALVRLPTKPRPLDIAKRRVRRPFSVAEVEALVHAVEKLGTGRWRDVKFQAFEQAKHRTYVDLKDKWKTLVHTARIAPHQRRGEPVPQELLERVTRAHTYWTTQAAKQQAELDY